MTKEHLALIAVTLGLIGTVLGAGMQIGTLTERIEQQRKQLEALSADLRAINQHFILWAGSHRD